MAGKNHIKYESHRVLNYEDDQSPQNRINIPNSSYKKAQTINRIHFSNPAVQIPSVSKPIEAKYDLKVYQYFQFLAKASSLKFKPSGFSQEALKIISLTLTTKP